MSTFNAPILPRHEQAALRALIPHDGAAVHMEITVESESARARRTAVAQAIADAEFERDLRAVRKWHWVGDGKGSHDIDVGCELVGVSCDALLEWVNNSLDVTDADLAALLLSGSEWQ